MFEAVKLYGKVVVKYNELLHLNSSLERLLSDFELRYKHVKGDKIDFLIAEDNFVSQLILKETLKIRNNHLSSDKKAEELYETFTKDDRHDENDSDALSFKAPYLKYPRFDIEGVKGHAELLHLVGAVIEFEKNYWQDITSFLRDVYPLKTNSPLEKIDNIMMSMIVMQVNKPPAVLIYFADFCRRGDQINISNSSFSAMKEIAFFLNEVLDMLNHSSYPEDKPAMRFLHNILSDFKITGLKRKKI